VGDAVSGAYVEGMVVLMVEAHESLDPELRVGEPGCALPVEELKPVVRYCTGG
jgi:hypothetical protein